MLFSKTHSFHSYYYFTLSFIYYSHLLTITKLLLGETFKWVHVRFYKRKFRPLKLVSILTNIINFNPKFVTFIMTSTIYLWSLFSLFPVVFIIISTIYSFLFILSLHYSLASFFLLSFFLSFFLRSYVHARVYISIPKR